MIHSFEELRERYRNGVGHRYIGAETGVPSEVDGPGEDDPRDEYLASATTNEIMQAVETEPGVPAPDPAPADEFTEATEPNPYLDFDLAPGDMAKLQNYGVRTKDAVDAGFTRVTSSESAFYLNRADTGDLEGILVPYRLLGPGYVAQRRIVGPAGEPKNEKGKARSCAPPCRFAQLVFFFPGSPPRRSG